MLSAVLLLSIAAPKGDCAEARKHYEGMALERALEAVELATVDKEEMPLDCLEVRALVDLTLGQDGRAKGALFELFRRDPDREVADPSLSPDLVQRIEEIRAEAIAVRSSVKALWLNAYELRLHFTLVDPAQRAGKVRFLAHTAPSVDELKGEVSVLGHSATATVAVEILPVVTSLRIKTDVLSKQDGQSLADFDDLIPLPERPEAVGEELALQLEKEREGISPWWYVGAGAAVAVVGAVVIVALLASPDLPNTDGTLGRAEVPGS